MIVFVMVLLVLDALGIREPLYIFGAIFAVVMLAGCAIGMWERLKGRKRY
jgi:hypothetical protein